MTDIVNEQDAQHPEPAAPDEASTEASTETERAASAGLRPLLSRATRLVSTHKWQAAAAGGVIGLVAVLGASSALSAGGGNDKRAAQAAGKPTIMAPADGALLVGSSKIGQMPGVCNGASCYHVAPSSPVEIKAGKDKSLPLKSGQSTLYTVAAFNLDSTAEVVPLSIHDGALFFPSVHPGHYQVTVTGIPNGGMWQFELTVGNPGPRLAMHPVPAPAKPTQAHPAVTMKATATVKPTPTATHS